MTRSRDGPLRGPDVGCRGAIARWPPRRGGPHEGLELRALLPVVGPHPGPSATSRQQAAVMPRHCCPTSVPVARSGSSRPLGRSLRKSKHAVVWAATPPRSTTWRPPTVLAQRRALTSLTMLFNLIVTQYSRPAAACCTCSGRSLEDRFRFAFLPKGTAWRSLSSSYNGRLDYGAARGI